MLYMLWDLESRNLVAECSTKREALELVMSGIERNGPQSIENLALEVADDEGNTASVAYGPDLAALARRELDATAHEG